MKKLIFTIIVLTILVCVFGAQSTCSSYDAKSKQVSITEFNKGRAKPCELIFNEDFIDFNLETWSHEITAWGGGNNEFQIYYNNRSNSYVKDGKLYIKPTLTADKYGEGFLSSGKLDLYDGAVATRCTNARNDGCVRTGTADHIIPPVMSARIRTINSFAFKYGTIKVRARLPSGDWLWPAIWLLPQSNQYGGWPASGELDLMESRGNLKLQSADGNEIGSERIGSTLHYGPHWPENGWDKAHYNFNSKPGDGFHKAFHDYELEWTSSQLIFKLDGKVYGKTELPKGGFWELGGFNKKNLDNPWQYSTNSRLAPFDQKFYIVLNLAVGGTNGYFPDGTTSTPNKPWKNGLAQGEASKLFWSAKEDWYPTWKDSSEFVIDYVKVYASNSVDTKAIHNAQTSKCAATMNYVFGPTCFALIISSIFVSL